MKPSAPKLATMIAATPTLTGHTVLGATLSPGGSVVAEWIKSDWPPLSVTLRLTDLAGGSVMAEHPLPWGQVLLRYSPDGERLLVVPTGPGEWRRLTVYRSRGIEAVSGEIHLQHNAFGNWRDTATIVACAWLDARSALIVGHTEEPQGFWIAVFDERHHRLRVIHASERRYGGWAACAPTGHVVSEMQTREPFWESRLEVVRVRPYRDSAGPIMWCRPQGPVFGSWHRFGLSDDAQYVIGDMFHEAQRCLIRRSDGLLLEVPSGVPVTPGLSPIMRRGALVLQQKTMIHVFREVGGAVRPCGVLSVTGTVRDLAPGDDALLLAVTGDRRTEIHRLTDPRIMLLASDDVSDRCWAARELAGDPRRDALPSLVSALRRKEPAGVEDAARALGALRDPSAIPHLVRALGRAESSEALRSAIAAFAPGGSPTVADAVRACFSSTERLVRRGAAATAQAFPMLDLTDVLCSALQDPDAVVRRRSAEALRKRPDLRACPSLLASTDDPDADARLAIRSALTEVLVAHGLWPAGNTLSPGDSELLAVAADVTGTGRWRTLSTDRRPGALLLMALAGALDRSGRPTKDLLNALNDLADHPASRQVSVVLAVLLGELLAADSRFDDAARAFRQAAAVAERLSAPRLVWRLWRVRGDCAEARGDLCGAAVCYDGAMRIIDRLWSRLLDEEVLRGFFADKAGLYEKAMLCQLRLGHPTVALECLEKAKTRYLGDLIARRYLAPRHALEPLAQQFWEFTGERRPVPSGSGAENGSGIREVIALEPGGESTGPHSGARYLPLRLGEFLRSGPTDGGWAGTMLTWVWQCVAAVQVAEHELGEHDDEARAAMDELYDLCTRIRDRAESGGVSPADVEGYREATGRIAQIGYLRDAGSENGFWALAEYSGALAGLLQGADEDVLPLLDALQEVTGYLTAREPVLATAWDPPEREIPDQDSNRENHLPLFIVAVHGATGTQPGPDSVVESAFRPASRTHWDYLTRLARGESAGVADAQRLLADRTDTALLEFALTDQETVIFIGRGRPRSQGPDWAGFSSSFSTYSSPVVTADTLDWRLTSPEGWLAAYREAGATSDEPALQTLQNVTDEILSWLYDNLFAPLGPVLKAAGIRRLLVIPHRGLHLFPLAAWHPTGSRHYVGDDFVVQYAPSLTLYDICASRSEAGRSGEPQMLLISNPRENLPLATTEATEARRALGFPRHVLLNGGDASVEAWSLYAPAASHTHYAGHARYLPKNPLESAFELADEPLTLGGLFEETLPLGSGGRFVALSGCETAMTDHSDLADEYLGLASGFLFAGARTVVSAVWRIEDLSAALLMRRFYRELAAGRQPAEALGRAQRWLRTEVRHRDAAHYLEQAFTEQNPPAEGDAAWDWLRDRLAYYHARRHSRTRPFEHPIFWAPFMTSGIDEMLPQ